MDKLMLQPGALSGKRIVVTGGGTGLGKSMTECFLQLGASVLICSRKEDVLKKAVDELNAKIDGTIHYAVCEVRDYNQVEAMLAQANERLGGTVNALVNNAAGNFVMPTERLSHKAFDVVTDIVLKGTYNCSLAFGKHWIATNTPATVLNIVTTYAFTGSAYVVPSAIAKAGVLALTKSLAVEWGPKNIRTNAVAPGPFPTEGAWSRLFPEQVRSAMDPARRIPMQRVGEHHELANLASYLVSDYSSFVNGEVVVIDGGEWLKGAGQFNDFDQVPEEFWDAWEKMRK
jgi:NAD(P)-dependent dehydrogenase (short-subunit alcohol dehydrogenase family)